MNPLVKASSILIFLSLPITQAKNWAIIL